jgi:hypothetical protein
MARVQPRDHAVAFVDFPNSGSVFDHESPATTASKAGKE